MSTNYGRDTSCTDRLRTGRFAVGLRLVAEAAYRRLITPAGSLLGSPDYGLDLAALVGSTSSAAEQATLPGKIRGELIKDERVNEVEATVERTVDAEGVVSFLVTIEAETDEGPFTLQLDASAVSVALLGITEA